MDQELWSLFLRKKYIIGQNYFLTIVSVIDIDKQININHFVFNIL